MLFSFSGKNILSFTPNLLKKIFILIPWFRPAYKAGGPIQSIANMLRAMGNDRIEFKIFCSNKDADDSLLQGVAFDEWVPYNANTKLWYSSSSNILPVLQQEIKKENPNHLFIIGIYDWQFNIRPLLFCKGVKKIVSVRGMVHPGALSQKAFKKKIYLGLWKLMGLHKQVIFHATDEEEKKYVRGVFGQCVNVKVAANFPRVFNMQPFFTKEPGYLKLASVALISPMKNILMVLQALESEQFANECTIGYNIYGPIKDKQYWDECLACIKKLPTNISVNYHGDINPDKIEEALAANHVFILPSKSENYGHAIIEALYAGRPVITSNNTPWHELEGVKAGINISLTDKQELVNAIGKFTLMDQWEMETWSKNARGYAEKAVNIDNIRRQYDELFD